MRSVKSFVLLPLFLLAVSAFGQPATPTPTPSPRTNFFKDIAKDQKAIWTSPFHVSKSDWKWLGPFLPARER
jgi:hypothetical protein